MTKIILSDAEAIPVNAKPAGKVKIAPENMTVAEIAERIKAYAVPGKPGVIQFGIGSPTVPCRMFEAAGGSITNRHPGSFETPEELEAYAESAREAFLAEPVRQERVKKDLQARALILADKARNKAQKDMDALQMAAKLTVNATTEVAANTLAGNVMALANKVRKTNTIPTFGA